MSHFFNPSNPKWRRGVAITSAVVCVFTASQVVIADFGSQDHIFTPLQRFINEKVDAYFNISAEELAITNEAADAAYAEEVKKNPEKHKPFISLTKVDKENKG